jgi:hypothetical protein
MPKTKPPARFYYGWFIAVTLAIMETISCGIIYYTFTIFITPMEQDLGWSRSELTGGFSLALLVASLLAFPVGAWIHRRGACLLMTTGAVLASLHRLGQARSAKTISHLHSGASAWTHMM